MKIYGTENNVYDAVDAFVNCGLVVVEGTKTPAVAYANRIIECLSVYPDVAPTIGYQNVINNGYLYYVYDINRFSIGNQKLKSMINKIDAANT